MSTPLTQIIFHLLYYHPQILIYPHLQNTTYFRTLQHKITNKELQNLLKSNVNYNVLIPVLIEINLRQNMEILSLKKRISSLETKTLKKPGRKRTTYYLHGKELTDEKLIYYIDYDYFTISELEREVDAPKNSLRNRYNRAKRLANIEKNASR